MLHLHHVVEDVEELDEAHQGLIIQHPYGFCNYHRCNITGNTIEVCHKTLRQKRDANTKVTTAVQSKEEERESTKTEDAAKDDSAYLSATCFL
jgi:hypothetical protein